MSQPHSPQPLTPDYARATEPYVSPPARDDDDEVNDSHSSSEHNQRLQRLNDQLSENGFSPIPIQKQRELTRARHFRKNVDRQKMRKMVVSLKRQLDLLEEELGLARPGKRGRFE